MGLDFTEKIKASTARLKSNEQMLGSGLQQPFSNTNSGSRKLMAATQRTHGLALMRPEKAIIETGYEIRFGEHCSSLYKAESDYQVIAKISKFSFAPNHHYWLILIDMHTGDLSVIERISYKHITESYGYMYNNVYLDNLTIGSYINKGDIVRKSLAFDDYNNRKDGVNLEVAYMALDENMEDSVVISDVAAQKLNAPLIKPVKFIINENDIPLNLYGNDNVYKVIPDIGEDINIENGILIALRKEKKEEALFMQSVDRLKTPLMSDEKYTLHGKVIDINIYCNNLDQINSSYYTSQLKMYYDESRRAYKELIQVITPYKAQGHRLSYDLQKLFANAKRIINGDKVMEKRLFSNIEIEIYILEDLKLSIGDKVSNRYGGKGVISQIIPQHLMPQNVETGEYVDMILNSSTMYNRENPGQSFEVSLNHISSMICDQISIGVFTPRESFNMIVEFIDCCSHKQAEELKNWGDKLSDDDIKYYVESVVEDGCIHLSSLPMTESMDIDKLNAIYKKFPGIHACKYKVPITDSDGNIRYVETRRTMVTGKQYTLRLKQYAEEKFSATSLSATNIRNENTKSKASRDYRELYSNTPIRAGSMEIDNMNHLGAKYVITALMIHSLSPHARRLVEKFYMDDPYKTDIKLDKNSSNRSVEILNTYLKSIGLRIKFIKRKKQKAKAVKFNAIHFFEDGKKNAIFFNNEENFDFMKDYEERLERDKQKKAVKFRAIKFYD